MLDLITRATRLLRFANFLLHQHIYIPPFHFCATTLWNLLIFFSMRIRHQHSFFMLRAAGCEGGMHWGFHCRWTGISSRRLLLRRQGPAVACTAWVEQCGLVDAALRGMEFR